MIFLWLNSCVKSSQSSDWSISISFSLTLSYFCPYVIFNIVFRGQSPLEAEFNLLETVRKVELYGMRNFPAKVRSSFQVSPVY